MPKFKKLFKKLKVNSLIYCMPTDLVEDSFSYWYYGIKQNIFFQLTVCRCHTLLNRVVACRPLPTKIKPCRDPFSVCEWYTPRLGGNF